MRRSSNPAVNTQIQILTRNPFNCVLLAENVYLKTNTNRPRAQFLGRVPVHNTSTVVCCTTWVERLWVLNSKLIGKTWHDISSHSPPTHHPFVSVASRCCRSVCLSVSVWLCVCVRGLVLRGWRHRFRGATIRCSWLESIITLWAQLRCVHMYSVVHGLRCCCAALKLVKYYYTLSD